MPKTSGERAKEDVLISQTPKLQTDVREQRKKESFQMIFQALERRFEDTKPSKS